MGQLTAIQEEFKALIDSVGWKPAAASRALGVSKVTVGRYVNGEQDPPERIMLLVRRLVSEEAARLKISPATLADQGASGPPVELRREALAEIARIDALTKALARAHERLRELLEESTVKYGPPTNSPGELSDSDILDAAVGDIEREHRARLRLPATGEPNEGTSEPKRDAGQSQTRPPSLPKSVPTEQKPDLKKIP